MCVCRCSVKIPSLSPCALPPCPQISKLGVHDLFKSERNNLVDVAEVRPGDKVGPGDIPRKLEVVRERTRGIIRLGTLGEQPLIEGFGLELFDDDVERRVPIVGGDLEGQGQRGNNSDGGVSIGLVVSTVAISQLLPARAYVALTSLTRFLKDSVAPQTPLDSLVIFAADLNDLSNGWSSTVSTTSFVTASLWQHPFSMCAQSKPLHFLNILLSVLMWLSRQKEVTKVKSYANSIFLGMSPTARTVNFLGTSASESKLVKRLANPTSRAFSKCDSMAILVRFAFLSFLSSCLSSEWSMIRQ